MSKLIFTAIIPVTALGIIPWLFYRLGWQMDALQGAVILLKTLAGLFFLFGLGLLAWTNQLFADKGGGGILAPWFPTQNFIGAGPYVCVRNPMMLSVFGIVLSEALFFTSYSLLFYLGLFILVAHCWIVLVEEKGLEQRFGQKYLAYKAQVLRRLPGFSKSGKDPQ